MSGKRAMKLGMRGSAFALGCRQLVVPLLRDRRADPLVPYLLGFSMLAAGLAAGAGGLFLAGALGTWFTTRSWWLGGLRQVGFGAIAAAQPTSSVR
jgi:hypothetical protein